jgi:hypothetical protein
MRRGELRFGRLEPFDARFEIPGAAFEMVDPAVKLGVRELDHGAEFPLRAQNLLAEVLLDTVEAFGERRDPFGDDLDMSLHLFGDHIEMASELFGLLVETAADLFRMPIQPVVKV